MICSIISFKFLLLFLLFVTAFTSSGITSEANLWMLVRAAALLCKTVLAAMSFALSLSWPPGDRSRSAITEVPHAMGGRRMVAHGVIHGPVMDLLGYSWVGPHKGPGTGSTFSRQKGVILGGPPKGVFSCTGVPRGGLFVLTDHSMHLVRYLHFRGWLSTRGGVLGTPFNV